MNKCSKCVHGKETITGIMIYCDIANGLKYLRENDFCLFYKER